MLTAVRRETASLHIRLSLVSTLFSCLPVYFASPLRVYALRWLGFQVGRETLIFGMPRILGGAKIEERLVIGRGCIINFDCVFDLSGRIEFEEKSSIGPESMLITGTHSIGPETNRLGDTQHQNICIGRGAWIGARVTILPGVHIGPGAVIGAGSVVIRDIPANTVCAGVPAKVIRQLEKVDVDVK